MYSRLNEVLTKFAETSLQIARALVFKLGCVALTTLETAPSPRLPITELEKLSPSETQKRTPPPNFHAAIVESLKKHPNVFDINVSQKQRLEYATVHTLGTLGVGKLFSLRVNLPHRLHRYSPHLRSETPREEFNVVSSGSLFAAFAPIDDYPAKTHIGHEYRELLTTQVEKETQFKCHKFGPIPIHPDFYCVLRKSTTEGAGVGMKVYAHDDDVFLVFDGDSITDLDMGNAILENIEFAMQRFYAALLIRSLLINYEVEILNDFASLASAIKTLSATEWWRLVRATRIARQGRTSLTNIHGRLVEFELWLSSFNRGRNEVLNLVKENEMVRHIESYFQRQLERDGNVNVSESLRSALEHFGGELQAFGHKRSVLMGGLVGGATGALLTGLFRRMF